MEKLSAQQSNLSCPLIITKKISEENLQKFLKNLTVDHLLELVNASDEKSVLIIRDLFRQILNFNLQASVINAITGKSGFKNYILRSKGIIS